MKNCNQCKQHYSGVYDNLPRILIQCGHTFCQRCIEQISTEMQNGEILINCFDCKTVTSYHSSIKNLPINQALLFNSELGSPQFQDQTPIKSTTHQAREDVCQIHDKNLEAYCVNNKELLCIDCILNQTQRALMGQNQHQALKLLSINQAVYQELQLIQSQSDYIQFDHLPLINMQKEKILIFSDKLKRHLNVQKQQINEYFDQVIQKIELQRSNLLNSIEVKEKDFIQELLDADSSFDANFFYQDEFLTQSKKVLVLDKIDQIQFLNCMKKLNKLYNKIDCFYDQHDFNHIKLLIDMEPSSLIPNFNKEKQSQELQKIISERQKSYSPISKQYCSASSFVNLKKNQNIMFPSQSNRQSLTRKSFMNQFNNTKDSSALDLNKNQQSMTKVLNPEDTLPKFDLDYQREDRIDQSLSNKIHPLLNIKKSFSTAQISSLFKTSIKNPNTQSCLENYHNKNYNKVATQRENSKNTRHSQSFQRKFVKNQIPKKPQNKLHKDTIVASNQQVSNIPKGQQNLRYNGTQLQASFLSDRRVSDSGFLGNQNKIQKTQQILARLSINHNKSQQIDYSKTTTASRKQTQKPILNRYQKEKYESKENRVQNQNQSKMQKPQINLQSSQIHQNIPTMQSLQSNQSNTSMFSQFPPYSYLSQCESPTTTNQPPHEAAIQYMTLTDNQNKLNCHSYQMKINRNPFKTIELNLISKDKKKQNIQRNISKLQANQIGCKNLIESNEALNYSQVIETTQFEEINYQMQPQILNDQQSYNEAFLDSSQEMNDELIQDIQELSINKINDHHNFRTYQEQQNPINISQKYAYNNKPPYKNQNDNILNHINENDIMSNQSSALLINCDISDESSRELYQQENTLIQDYIQEQKVLQDSNTSFKDSFSLQY